jgi:hypothetical protein
LQNSEFRISPPLDPYNTKSWATIRCSMTMLRGVSDI